MAGVAGGRAGQAPTRPRQRVQGSARSPVRTECPLADPKQPCATAWRHDGFSPEAAVSARPVSGFVICPTFGNPCQLLDRKPQISAAQAMTACSLNSMPATRTFRGRYRSLGQNLFDLAQRQRIANLHRHHAADDRGRTVETTEGILHPPTRRTRREPPQAGLVRQCPPAAPPVLAAMRVEEAPVSGS